MLGNQQRLKEPVQAWDDATKLDCQQYASLVFRVLQSHEQGDASKQLLYDINQLVNTRIGNGIRDLRDFVQRVRTLLYSIPTRQRPDGRLTGEWLFHRVKHIKGS